LFSYNCIAETKKHRISIFKFPYHVPAQSPEASGIFKTSVIYLFFMALARLKRDF